MFKIKMIFAFEYNINTNQFIFGKDMTLPWGHIPKDMELFKEYTSCKEYSDHNPVMVMGDKTYESLKDKNLRNREFWVLSSKKRDDGDYFRSYNDLDELIEDCKNRDGAVTVIGGKSILESFMGIADEISVSYILKRRPSDANVFLDKKMFKKMFLEYKIKNSEIFKSEDEENDWTLIRMILERK